MPPMTYKVLIKPRPVRLIQDTPRSTRVLDKLYRHTEVDSHQIVLLINLMQLYKVIEPIQPEIDKLWLNRRTLQ
jgi:hypothetical protein